MQRLHEILQSFTCALILCIVGLLNVASAAYEGSDMIWFDVAFVCFWVFMGKRAIERGADKDEFSMTLTREQKARLHEASTNMANVLAEIQREYKQAELAHNLKQREKARVQSDKREDKEAGPKGDD